MSLRGKTALGLCLLFALAYADEGCDKSQCKGPMRYYEDLKCKPMYAKPDDCCPMKYDCSHLEGRSTDKCYANGKKYAVGDQLKDEDRANSCDMNCKCMKRYGDMATFSCAAVECFNQPPPRKGCFMKSKPENCCADEEVCPNEGEEKVTCQVNGQTYHEGESFSPEEKPGMTCTCEEGFKGEFVEPFCKKASCGTELRRSSEIHNKCAPVYYNTQSPATSCSAFYRCQNDKDQIMKSAAEKSSTEDKSDKCDSDDQPCKTADMKCTFGNMKMEIGDELNQATDYSSVCVKCVCEVPPTPTCQRLSDTECDMTKHRRFN